MKSADVIIVLGAAVWPGAAPSPSLERRVFESVRLYKNQIADYLLFSGGLGIHPPEECVVMKERAIALGVASEKILLEPNSSSTFASVVNCIEIMRSKGFKDAIIVTDSYHILRCIISFRLLGIRCIGYGAHNKKGETPYIKWFYYHLREIVAVPWYVVRCLAYLLSLLKKKQESELRD